MGYYGATMRLVTCRIKSNNLPVNKEAMARGEYPGSPREPLVDLVSMRLRCVKSG